MIMVMFAMQMPLAERANDRQNPDVYGKDLRSLPIPPSSEQDR